MQKSKIYNRIIAILAAIATLMYFLPTVVIVTENGYINMSFSALSLLAPSLILMLLAPAATGVICLLFKGNKGTYVASISLSAIFFLNLFNSSYASSLLIGQIQSSYFGSFLKGDIALRPTFWVILTYIIMVLIIIISIVALVAVKLENDGKDMNAENFVNYTSNAAKEVFSKVSETVSGEPQHEAERTAPSYQQEKVFDELDADGRLKSVDTLGDE